MRNFLGRHMRSMAANLSLAPADRNAVSPGDYDNAERDGAAQHSVPVLQAFRPVTYQSVGFPIHVTSERELVRYVDHNFESEVPKLYQPAATFAPVGYVNSFTRDEAALVARVRDMVADFSAARFGRRTRPMTNLLVQVGPYRAMEAISAVYGLKQLNVFEAGPGLAYLGALLALQGHRYTSYDVTQALYLWQSHLLSAAGGNDFLEYALPANQKRLGSARVGHLPWWTFASQLHSTRLRCDLVYSNSNLGEMSQMALRHLLHIARAMLADSKLGIFMYFSTGALAQSTREGLDAEFEGTGYVKVMDAPFVCYQVQGRDPQPLIEAFVDGIPFYNPSGSAERLDAKALVATSKAEAPLDALLTQWYFGWQAPLE